MPTRFSSGRNTPFRADTTRTAALFFAMALWAVHPESASASPPATRPDSIRVVSDDNYPPYIFRDTEGKLRGILPDQWALWQQKTGVRVELDAMDWADAQRTILAGEADVIDTIFRTAEREPHYDFTPPYAQLRVPVFAHESLGGLTDVASLHGFQIGVKAGDAVIETLRSHGLDNLKEYPSYEAIVQAARARDIKVFSIDEPPAIYYLYKYDIAKEHRTRFVLYTGEFHRAVRKGDTNVLALVQEGFDRISPREYKAIEDAWMGTPIQWPEILRRFTVAALIIAGAFLTLAVGNLLLGRQVQRRTAELHANRTRLETILRLAPIGIGVLDRHRFLEVNEAFCAMVGCSREELIGRDMGNAHPTRAECQRIRKLFEDIMEHGAGSAELTVQRPDGSEIRLLGQGTRLDPATSGGEVIFTALDITARQQAEEERLRVERRIQEAQKIESLGVLAGGIAHDFNNLLTAIIGNIDLALLDIPADSSARKDLAMAMTATHRVADLAQKMLAFSGKGHFMIGPQDLCGEVRTTIQLLASSLPRDVELHLHLPAGLPPIEADAAQIRQVLMNLVLNAAEAFGPDPGLVEVTVGLAPHGAISSARLWPDAPLEAGPYLYVEVSDTGCGVPAELIEKLFDPFFSTKFTGRGLGLAAVLGIVRGHKGAIQVDSVVGQGSTFRAYFPVWTGPAAATEASGLGSPPPSPAVRGTLLLVDDEESLRDVACKLLTRLGFAVICAADGEQAIRLFQARADRFDGVILDLAMPRKDGAQTLVELRGIRPDIRVAISSGYAESEVQRHFQDIRPDGFIPKPYTLNGLREALDRIWPA